MSSLAMSMETIRLFQASFQESIASIWKIHDGRYLGYLQISIWGIYPRLRGRSDRGSRTGYSPVSGTTAASYHPQLNTQGETGDVLVVESMMMRAALRRCRATCGLARHDVHVRIVAKKTPPSVSSVTPKSWLSDMCWRRASGSTCLVSILHAS